MSSIVRIEITHCLGSPNVNVDQTAKRYNRSFVDHDWDDGEPLRLV
jgi:hypothetical protein